jgi:hypothetical protein
VSACLCFLSPRPFNGNKESIQYLYGRKFFANDGIGQKESIRASFSKKRLQLHKTCILAHTSILFGSILCFCVFSVHSNQAKQWEVKVFAVSFI